MKPWKSLAACLSLVAGLIALGLPVRHADASVNPMSLGAVYDSGQTQITFRVYSSEGTHMVLYLYSAGYGVQESATYTLTNEGGGVWQVIVPVSSIQAAGITGAVYYGYRAWGPNWTYSASWRKGSAVGFVSDVDSNGNRFNPNKLLLDPYAREVSQDVAKANSGANITPPAFLSGATNRNTDSGPIAPKGIVLAAISNKTGTKPAGAQKNDIIYEVNLRGLTQQNPSISSSLQGTYAGAAQMATYLSSLGITAIELQPLQEIRNDQNNNIASSDAIQNYWGYGAESFFSPDRRYASNKAAGGPTAEFQAMVQSFHNAGIKVLLDVVYNHTDEGETSSTDPTTAVIYSWRGFDNPTYYEPTSDNQYYYDNTCCGNYNTFAPVAQNLIIDSMSYWVNTMGVDGFRFDLGELLGNTCTNGCNNFSATAPGTALQRILKEFTVRPAGGGSGLDFYVEPYDASGHFYLGQFPAGYSEWNTFYRDTLRQAQNELGNMTYPSSGGSSNDNCCGSTTFIEQEANDWTGSAYLFQWNRQPWNSTNFIDIHDGLTLNDVYACNGSNNTQAWPWGPSTGGTSTNYSWDQGMSAGTGTAADQRRAARTGLAFVLLSAGTPIFAGGDEFLRTVQCNNNPYNLDSSGTWLNWSWSTHQQNFNDFATRGIAFRKAHPALRPATWYTSSQVTWWEPSGAQATSSYWSTATNYAIAYTINGSSLGDSSSMYIAFNGWSGEVTFTLPTPPTGTAWYRVTDTCNWNDGPNTWAAPGNETYIGGAGSAYNQCAQSLLLLMAK